MTRKTKILLFRWSLFATMIVAAFWGVWYAIAGSVPERSELGLWPFGSFALPFAISRWWDVALAAPVALAVWRLGLAADRVEAKFRQQPGDFYDGFMLITGLCLLGAPLAGTSGNLPIGASVGAIVTASASLILAVAYRDARVTLHFGFMAVCGISILSFALLGSAAAAPWVALTAIACAFGFGLGRLLRRSVGPLEWLVTRLAGDDIPKEESREPAPVVSDAPRMLAEYDRVVQGLAALDTEEGRIPARRRELELQLKALHADPEIAKYAALRAERAAA